MARFERDLGEISSLFYCVCTCTIIAYLTPASLVHTMTGTTKELLIESGDIKAEVEISETDTLKDVRALILEEFDDDMLPCQDFCFHVNDIRVSTKQERKKLAWNLSNKPIRLHLKQGTKRKLEASTEESTSIKRGRSENENHNETRALATTLACAPINSPPFDSSGASIKGVTSQSNDSSTGTSSAIPNATKDASFHSCKQQKQEQEQVHSEEQDQQQVDSNAEDTADSPLPCKRLDYQENTTHTEEDAAFYSADEDEATAKEDSVQGESPNDDLEDDEKTLEMMDPDDEPDNDDDDNDHDEFPPMDPDTNENEDSTTAQIEVDNDKDDMQVTTSTALYQTNIENSTAVQADQVQLVQITEQQQQVWPSLAVSSNYPALMNRLRNEAASYAGQVVVDLCESDDEFPVYVAAAFL